ncbi:hypothetical protein KSP40_PGU014854 [Platanthera guangdongensis]|uniref:Uncharacterized protein n=1 Tax=Platanthera guangdongensis TaxID=2320717 RepID=A0ABR2M8S8_9ASPA
MEVRPHNVEDINPPNSRAITYDVLNVGLGDIGKIKIQTPACFDAPGVIIEGGCRNLIEYCQCSFALGPWDATFQDDAELGFLFELPRNACVLASGGVSPSVRSSDVVFDLTVVFVAWVFSYGAGFARKLESIDDFKLDEEDLFIEEDEEDPKAFKKGKSVSNVCAHDTKDPTVASDTVLLVPIAPSDCATLASSPRELLPPEVVK